VRHDRTLAVCLGLLIGGCAEPRGDVASVAQWYRAHLTTDTDDRIPFFVQVPADCESASAIIVNGAESLEAECRQSPVGFVIDFPVYATQIEAWFKPDGTLTGHWCREGATGREPVLSMKAVPVSTPNASQRFDGDTGEAGTQIAGAWRFDFERYGAAKAVFVATGDGGLTASVEIPSEYGDMRYLAGNVRDGRARLSTFDGQHAYLLDASIDGDETMTGEWIRATSRDAFVAERDEGFEIPDPLARVPVVPGEQRLDLDLLQDPKFEGKGVIVEVFGTWCPNCNDIAPILAELYDEHHANGLEILGLAYEYGHNVDYKEQRIEAFRNKHGVRWDLVLMESPLEDLTAEGLFGLDPIEGVPVTIFIRRDGTVHAVYAGVSGPATGDAYERTKAELERLTAEILD